METVANIFRTISAKITDPSSTLYWAKKIQEDFGLKCGITKTLETPHLILRQAHQILSKMGAPLVKACGVNKLILRDDMGENKRYSPNHGYFHDQTVALNTDIFVHPDYPEDFSDARGHGYFLTRGEETLIHELGHAFDVCQGDLSGKPEWLKLSGWSYTPKPGLKRLIINEPGTPQVIGEMWYDPKAGFTRFYAKRNTWDDWADSFAFYVGGFKSNLPANKTAYFDKILKKYL